MAGLEHQGLSESSASSCRTRGGPRQSRQVPCAYHSGHSPWFWFSPASASHAFHGAQVVSVEELPLPAASPRRGVHGGGRDTYCIQGWPGVLRLLLLWCAQADEGQPEAAAWTEGLAAGEPHTVPLLPHCQLREISCGGEQLGWIGHSSDHCPNTTPASACCSVAVPPRTSRGLWAQERPGQES